MKNYISEFLSMTKEYINSQMEKASVEDLQFYLKEFDVKLLQFQHERLVHLIVTVLFALLEMISLATMLITYSFVSIILCVLFLVLLIPYVAHYYFLENSCQELYKIRDQILEKLSSDIKASK